MRPISRAHLLGLAHAQPFYANELGYFQRAGAEMVAANALDVCLADAIQVAHPVSAGVPLAFFAGPSPGSRR